MNKEGSLALTSLGFGAVLAILALYGLCSFKVAGLEATKAKILLSETLGSPFMALAVDCTAPGKLVEGLAECLGDIPGGYCYHTSCDVIQAPCLAVDQPFKVAILPASRL
jgi:hypothetical protein